ncbi:protein LAX PANICLE 2 isoform X1 [Lactuca sativa]|uniref:protein LAX PANICLE 2 isoform X1 n=1 Tax=Lactuca sativa TaxID=4236 RepID=UPI000CCB02F5|nr:protein LAX PANICLE 2 isoform X1 [Lactuca sativa]
MTMFPVHRQNLRKKNSFGCYGGACGGGRRYLEGEYDCFISLGGASDLMAEDESRTEISINNEETAGSSSKQDNIHQEINKEDDGGWLQLSLGGGTHVQSTMSHNNYQISLGPRLVELDLLPGGSGSSSGGGETSSQQILMRPLNNLTAAPLPPPPPQHHHHHLGFQAPDFRSSLPIITAAPSPTFFLQQHRGSPASTTIDSLPAMTFIHHDQQYDNNFLPFRPYPLTLNPHLSSSPSFSGSLEQPPGSGSYQGRPLHFPGGLDITGPPPRIDLRVVDPPRRPHSGVWFILQASQNQTKEPYLPQVPKSYLRIKDGRMTVRLLIKYLVNKLKLDSEFEVEITCKGQQLLPFMTLQHVRDNIWNSPRNEVVFPHSSATIDHLMLLNYGRIA